MGLNSQLHVMAALLWKNTPGLHWLELCMDPRASLDRLGKKNFLSLAENLAMTSGLFSP
jgi:hypothetical protein